MGLGLIARADFGRGLANQTYSFYKHLKPDVTVVIDMSLVDTRGQWPQDFTKYPDAIITQWRGYTAPISDEAYQALRSTDLIYTAETYYDPRLEKHPAILHVNPEFYRGEPAYQFWYPTTWELSRLPKGEVIPTPIDDDDIAYDIPESSVLLHVGGHSARMDRNGSQIVGGTLERVKHPWRITSQDGMRLRNPRVLSYVTPLGYVPNRWALYDGAGILVYPRRYGGQSLQVNEAMARGLAVVMTDCEPNIETWPIVPMAARGQSRIQTPGGTFVLHTTSNSVLADTLGTLIRDPDLRRTYQLRSLAWARDNAWSQWKPRILELVYG